MKGLAIFIISLIVTISVSAQTGVETDSIDTSVFDKNPYRFRLTQLIIPGVLIGVGFVGLESDFHKRYNTNIFLSPYIAPKSKVLAFQIMF